MTEPTIAGQPLTDAQRAYLTAEAARMAAEQSATLGPAAEQAAVAAAMTDRGPLLPAEEKIDELMAQLKAQSDQLAAMGAALTSVQRQMTEAQAASGGPLTVRYAQGAVDKLVALAAQWPNHPLAAQHFTPAHEHAAALLEASHAVVKGTRPVQAVHDAAAGLERFITRVHPRTGGHPIDWSAILDDVELAAEEAVKLAAVA